MTNRDFPFQAVRAGEERLLTLQGKTAIVTAAGSGIGRAVALLFAEEGANVVVADHEGQGAEATVAAIEAARGRACYFPGDISDPHFQLGLAAFAKHRYGWLDIAVNGVAVSSPSTPLAAIPLASWDAITTNNISGTFYATRAQIPMMLESGGGTIVNIVRVDNTDNAAGAAIRRATIEGLIALTKAVADEYGAQGIRANVIVPSREDQQGGEICSLPARGTSAGLAATNHIKTLGEAAEAALFLASAKSAFVNGACLPLSGALDTH